MKAKRGRKSRQFVAADKKRIKICRWRSLREFNRFRNLYLWLPVTIASPLLPWGYKLDPTNNKMAIPDENARLLFLKAYEYLQKHSYKEISEWCTAKGFPITDDGLAKIYKERPVWPEIALPYEERLKL